MDGENNGKPTLFKLIFWGGKPPIFGGPPILPINKQHRPPLTSSLFHDSVGCWSQWEDANPKHAAIGGNGWKRKPMGP